MICTHNLFVPTVPELPARGTGPLRQVWIHMRRQALLSYRDPTLYLSRFVMFMITSIFFAWVYVQARVRTQDQARAPSLLRCAPPASVRAFDPRTRLVFCRVLDTGQEPDLAIPPC